MKAKHDRFIAEYLLDQNATRAARRAGYRRARQTGSDLLRRPEIAAEIKRREAELVAKVEKKAGVSREWLLEQLVRNYERAMQARPICDQEGNPIGEFRYQGNFANKALELIGRAIGVFIARKDVGEPGEFDHLSDDELEREMVREAELLGFSRRRTVTETSLSKGKRRSSTRH